MGVGGAAWGRLLRPRGRAPTRARAHALLTAVDRNARVRIRGPYWPPRPPFGLFRSKGGHLERVSRRLGPAVRLRPPEPGRVASPVPALPRQPRVARAPRRALGAGGGAVRGLRRAGHTRSPPHLPADRGRAPARPARALLELPRGTTRSYVWPQRDLRGSRCGRRDTAMSPDDFSLKAVEALREALLDGLRRERPGHVITGVPADRDAIRDRTPAGGDNDAVEPRDGA